jgi:hypothetical protein
MVCDDHIPCTRDECIAGTCIAEADSSRCDTTECSMATCAPGRPGTDAKGCTRVPVDEGDPCTSDGVPCTDDVCRAGTCAHEHVDTRCTPADTCGTAVCFPELATADAAGCVPGTPSPDGGECSEDGDACTDDACKGGTCDHANVANRSECDPVQGVFGEARKLKQSTAAMQVSLAADITGDPGAGALNLRAALAERLAALDAGLDVVERILAGRAPAAGGNGTLAQRRAKAAFLAAKALPPRAQSMLSLVQLSRKRHEVGRTVATTLLQRARSLLTATKALKRDLRRLQRINQSFAR